MSKSNVFENDWMLLLFNATAIANIADNASSGALTNLYVGLHTGDPGEAGNQQSSEANYGAYARVAVARSGAGWTVSNNQASNAGIVTFAEAISGTNTISHVSVGTAASGAGKILYSGPLDTPLSVTTGIQPRFQAGELIFQED